MDIAASEEAKRLLDMATRQSTEIVLLGLAQCRVSLKFHSFKSWSQMKWSPLHDDVVSKLAVLFVMGHSSSSFILQRLWQSNSQVVVTAMINIFNRDHHSLSRILDVSQELKVRGRARLRGLTQLL